MNPLTATYLNRLSDLLFILARSVNRRWGTCCGYRGANGRACCRAFARL